MTFPEADIVIIGLGPGDPDTRTIAAQRALDRADRIVLRTRIHPGLDDLAGDPRVTSCDDLYDSIDDFEDLYREIAGRVVSIAAPGVAVVFAVPGHPRFGERSVPLVEAAAREAGFGVAVLDAVSFVDAAANAFHVDPLAENLQIADAVHIASILDAEPYAAGSLAIDPTRPLLIGQVYSQELATAVKLALSRVYPDEHRVAIVRSAGISGAQHHESVFLYELDRRPVDHLTTVWVDPMAPLDALRGPGSLTRIVARLRRPDGCPWDRKQDHATLRNAVLEEAYEVVDAIDAGNSPDLAEELGDLLLLIEMNAQIAEEYGHFRIEDVYEGISRKLIRRHPHVFGDVEAKTPDAVVATWEDVKAVEREAKGVPARSGNPLDHLPRSMPITRKVIESLAARTTLQGPEGPTDGATALASIAALIHAGIDPERALELALRARLQLDAAEEETVTTDVAAGERGGTRA